MCFIVLTPQALRVVMKANGFGHMPARGSKNTDSPGRKHMKFPR